MFIIKKTPNGPVEQVQITTKNITYHWDEGDNYFALIPSDVSRTSNYHYVVQKLVLDNFINMHTQYFSVRCLIKKHEEHTNGLLNIEFEREGFDSFK